MHTIIFAYNFLNKAHWMLKCSVTYVQHLLGQGYYQRKNSTKRRPLYYTDCMHNQKHEKLTNYGNEWTLRLVLVTINLLLVTINLK